MIRTYVVFDSVVWSRHMCVYHNPRNMNPSKQWRPDTPVCVLNRMFGPAQQLSAQQRCIISTICTTIPLEGPSLPHSPLPPGEPQAYQSMDVRPSRAQPTFRLRPSSSADEAVPVAIGTSRITTALDEDTSLPCASVALGSPWATKVYLLVSRGTILPGFAPVALFVSDGHDD